MATKISRRGFLRGAGVAAGTAVALKGSQALGAAPANAAGDVEFDGMLFDATLCVGCRACEAACAEANGNPAPTGDDAAAFEIRRDTSTEAFTVVNRFANPKNPDEPIHVRRQCMHCNQPGCASACLVKALEKTKEGAVIYNKDRCMGCRYCMIACPFDVPKYEYHSASPYVRKCTLCYARRKEGLGPACAEACPTGATLYGKKRELLEIARSRVYTQPDKYHPHVYGEHEVGGTAWLYLLPSEPAKLGLPANLGTTPYPELTAGFLYGVPLVFVLWPSLLYGLDRMTRAKANREQGEADHGDQE